jgi:ribosomal protein S18 acetylase RimI-like enzyme
MALTSLSLPEIPEVVDLVNRCHAVDGPNIRVEVEEFRQELNSSLTVMDRDVQVSRDETGRIHGIAWTLHFPADSGLQRCYVEGAVDPESRGRGHGRALLDWGTRHARELLAASTPGSTPSSTRVIRVSRSVHNQSAARLHDRFDFVPVRWFDDLMRSLDDVPDLLIPSGVVVEPWPENSLDVLPVKNQAFADHWGSSPTTPEGWHELVHGFAGRPDLSTVARDTDSREVVGFLLTCRYPADDEVNGGRQVWISQLGTLATHRGRGIATGLIVDALHRYRTTGHTHAMIGVDSESPTGAHRLYKSLGFALHHSTVTSEIVL